MRTIIAGSRSLDSYWFVYEAIADCGWKPTVILSGRARGIDLEGECYGNQNNIPVELYPADWSLGRGAGLMRNKTMADKAEALVAIWDGKSPGTAHMINIARSMKLKVYVMIIDIKRLHY